MQPSKKPRFRFGQLLTVDPDFEAAERQGFALALLLQTAVIFAFLLFVLLSVALPRGNWVPVIFAVCFLSVTVAYLGLIRSGYDRPWYRFVFLTGYVAAIVVVAALAPINETGGVPQNLVFFVYGADIFFVFIAMTCLTLSPWLVIWTGASCVAGLWALYFYVKAGLSTPLSFTDIPPQATAEQYMSIVLSPQFVGFGNRVDESLFLIGTALLLGAAVARARALASARVIAERQRAKIENVFGQYVPEPVAEAIVADDGVLAPIERPATIMFVDIVQFTELSDKKSPQELVEVVSAFFEQITPIAVRHDGIVVSYIGDAILIVFNLPIERPDYAASAVRAAAEILEKVDRDRFAGQRLDVRIGLASGAVSAGTVGTRGHLTYTVYGATVNLAQRLETENKDRGTRLLACNQTVERAGVGFDWQHVGDVGIRGLSARRRIATLADQKHARSLSLHADDQPIVADSPDA
jgi:class 3 adenylate cyclase